MILNRQRVSTHAAIALLSALALAGLTPALRGQEPEPLPLAEGAPPLLRYSDLESGPNTGGQGGLGAFVTVYGAGFGASRGTSVVTVGGGAVDNYPVWTDNKITFQLGAAAASGSIVVNVGGQASNGLPFTVRTGNIYFVATTGNDGGTGTFAAPWRTVVKAKDSLAAGDIAYLMNGVRQATEERYNAAVSIETSGTAARPKALIAYPGATVTIGSTSLGGGLYMGIRVPNLGIAATDWVIAGLRLHGETALDIGGMGSGSHRWRVVGNYISCPNGDGPTGCISVADAHFTKFFGNEVTDTGRSPASSKQYHAVYFTTDSNNFEVAWNRIHHNRTCNAIQAHSSPVGGNSGLNQYGISIHDNRIDGDNCSGINLATVDPSKGKVEAYNNVISNVGTGPEPPDGYSGTNCVYVPGYTNAGADGTGFVEVYNNTCVNAGNTRAGSASGAFNRFADSSGLILRLRNNVVYQPAGQPYIAHDSTSSRIQGSHNLWFGDGTGPSYLTNNINADPAFVDAGGADLHLRDGSPAIDAGTGTVPARDFDGNMRSLPVDVGAFEHGASGGGGLPEIRVDDRSVTEGNGGTVNVVFTVSLSSAAAQSVSVQYATDHNTATAGVDYLSASGTLTLVAGATSGTITVAVNGDTLVEGNETFWLNLDGATGASVADGQGVGTIMDDDQPASTPELVTPAPGSTLTATTVTFSWSPGANVTQYALRVGTRPGGRQIFGGTVGTSLSRTVRGLPSNGRTVYVRLRWRVGGVWSYRDYTYTALSR
jgi:hypothetical protein